MSTNVATLTLMEETQLWMDWAVGDRVEDVGKATNLTSAGWALRAACSCLTSHRSSFLFWKHLLCFTLPRPEPQTPG